MAGSILGADRGGSEGGKPFAPEVLQGFVPAQLGGMERTAIEARADTAMAALDVKGLAALQRAK